MPDPSPLRTAMNLPLSKQVAQDIRTVLAGRPELIDDDFCPECTRRVDDDGHDEGCGIYASQIPYDEAVARLWAMVEEVRDA